MSRAPGAPAEELAVPKAPPGQTEFLVSVPPGTLPGTPIQTATPDGQVISFLVPDDFVDGQVIPIFYTPLGRAATSEIGVEPPPGGLQKKKSRAEIRLMMQTFRDAKDRWKVDGQTMKGYYLHGESGYLYIWDQPTGVLFEYEQADGSCNVVWRSSLPAVNAEIWQTLPLPPTDPASMQASQAPSEEALNLDVFIILTVAHESGRQLPPDVLEQAAADFCARMGLREEAARRLRSLPAAGQHFVIQNFRCEEEKKRAAAFISYIDKMLKRPRPPWGSSACTLVVHAAGAIVGRCSPDLDALCRGEPPGRLAQAHCKFKCEQDRFFVCDLNSSEEGTTLDGFAVNDEWIGPLKSGSLLAIGPLRIKIQLSDMAKDTPLPSSLKRPLDEEDPQDGVWQSKVYQVVQREQKALAAKKQQDYKDRAEERRQRTKGEAGSVAIEGLVNRFNSIREAEKAAEEAEDSRVEAPTLEAHREANMANDGSFLGGGGFERAGIGFHSGAAAELIPNVLDPRNLSTKDTAQLKMQMRMDQLNRQQR